MSKLNNRQWHLYNYLKSRGNQWTKQADIAAALPEWYPIQDGRFHDHTVRLRMTNDIRAINDNETIQKIIISSNKGVKIATSEEFVGYIKRQYICLFKKLKRIRLKERKGQMDGQTRLVFNSERDIIEAFLKDECI